MRSSSIILTALAAVASAANQAPNRAPQALAAASAAIRERRDLDACNSVATAVLPRITDAPTAPADVAAYLAISATITDACVDPTITGSVGSAYSTYASELTSWREKHMSDFRAVWQACSDVSGVVNVLPTGSGQCSSLVAQITSAGPVNNGGGGGGGSGSGNGGGVGNAARPRETGAVVAVVAVAGFVVAALY
ncbi:hypothetical protein CTA2_1747 [Colletotrichum tanaceti]|uniref:Infection structure specific protein n=1 Tax=Colletotrichum tanaceti TaxID=1306861 RepID=A0A4U6WYG1_9PEZI|nr:hypothetical protein CTA2_1747 [Colletotrichum tanaceti]TKW48242.1 hypothetical protein CTA1_12044 [Colletotrichum tanaceti]